MKILDEKGRLAVVIPEAVYGPASAVNDNLAVFDGTTGKLIKDSGKPLTNVHTHPSFRAYKTDTQTLAYGTWTKIQFNVEEWDDNNEWDSVTNYRYTPATAGKYLMTATVAVLNMSNGTTSVPRVYKNGTTALKYGGSWSIGADGRQTLSITAIVSANGTDYFEVWVYNGDGVNRNTPADSPWLCSLEGVKLS